MSKRLGRQTVVLSSKPKITGWASLAGPKEAEGPYGSQFDKALPDERNGKPSFEAAERSMLETAVRLCAQKGHKALSDVQMLLSGDLLNQIITSGYAARSLGIPFYGLYGACSTMAESLALGGMLVDGGFADALICSTSSHFCTAERQYRTPLELGCQRTPTAQWTVTGSGAVLVEKQDTGPGTVCLTHATCGRVVDLGIADPNNMGAAMAPAAADTLCAHLSDTGRSIQEYDLIVTGDLGQVGRSLLMELLKEKGYAVKEDQFFDCGCAIFSEAQDVHAGGSGCGCSACVLCAHLLPKLCSGELRRILFAATGALLSPTATLQGESIPGIAHAVVLEHGEGAVR